MTGPCSSSQAKFVDAMARAHTHELGFIPNTVYDAALERGTLRVYDRDRDHIGFILHGPLKYEAKIWQVFTLQEFRLEDEAAACIRGILHDMRERNLERITCRVADDLEAVKFWQAMGFHAIEHIHTDDVWKRPLTRYEFTLPAGLQIDEAIAREKKKGKTQQLLDLFGMQRPFEASIKRRERRKR